jgi:long-chain acyl-CoA synthetase
MAGALAQQLQTALGRTPTLLLGGEAGPFAAADLLATADGVAHGLMGHEITPNEPVLCHSSNGPLDLAAMLGIWRAGGVAVPVSAAAASASAASIRGATGARLRVAGAAIEQISPDPAPPARELLRDAALIVFTSGSTGKPKGVVLGHQRLAAKLDVLDRLIGLGPADTVVVPLRLTFIFGIWVSLLSILHGARLVLMPKFTAGDLAAKLAEGASAVALVPSMLRTLLLEVPTPAAPRLRSLLAGGEVLSRRLGAEARAALPRSEIYDLYGLTETGSCDFCLPPAEFDAGLGSIGRPTELVEYRIVDANGGLARPGVAGALCIKTPFGMLGYLDDPSLTAACYGDGFLITGDQARLRPDGRVEIVGRFKDIIARGGNKIAPAEIETLLSSHPEVTAALCAGAPDVRLGECIVAIVTLAPGSALTAAQLRGWAAGQIEKFKVPDAIYVRDALPTGGSGKLDRTAVTRFALAARNSTRPEVGSE